MSAYQLVYDNQEDKVRTYDDAKSIGDRSLSVISEASVALYCRSTMEPAIAIGSTVGSVAVTVSAEDSIGE